MTAKYFFGRDEEDRRGDRSHNLVGLVDGEEDIRVMLLVPSYISSRGYHLFATKHVNTYRPS